MLNRFTKMSFTRSVLVPIQINTLCTKTLRTKPKMVKFNVRYISLKVQKNTTNVRHVMDLQEQEERNREMKQKLWEFFLVLLEILGELMNAIGIVALFFIITYDSW